MFGWGTPTTQVNSAVRVYIEKFVKEATKGNVTVEWAYATDRMILGCHKCNMTLTCSVPEGTEVDYQIQEFTKIHSHIGGHKDKPTGDVMWDKTGTKLIPLTADFKKVGGIIEVDKPENFSPLNPLYYNPSHIKNLKEGTPLIDKTMEGAVKISSQMEKYAKEMTPEAIAAKAKEIDAFAAKMKEAILKTLTDKGIPAEEVTDLMLKEQEQKLKNSVKLAEMKKLTQIAQGFTSGVHNDPAPKPVKPVKILKTTGRRFR